MHNAEDILNFWFYEVNREKWFAEDSVLDQQIRDLFQPAYEAAVDGKLKDWERTPEGVLALLLLLCLS